jgi:hypothetical protein
LRSRVKQTIAEPEGLSSRYSALVGTAVRSSTFLRSAAAYSVSMSACDAEAAGAGAGGSAGNSIAASDSSVGSSTTGLAAMSGAACLRIGRASCACERGGDGWGGGGAGTSSSRDIRTPGSLACCTDAGAWRLTWREIKMAAVTAKAAHCVRNSGEVRYKRFTSAL